MSQPTLWNGIDPEETGGAYRKDGPQQSLTAARNVKVGTWHAYIMELLLTFYPEGLTASCVADNSPQSGKGTMTPEKANTRLKELREKGYVEFAIDEITRLPVQAPTTPGNTGSVHRLTRDGYNEALRVHAERITGGGQ